MRYVAVIGPGDTATRDETRAAHEVGRLLAERDAIVVTGGLGGVMMAAARGCTEAGGTAVGLLPGTDRDAANPYLTVALPTGLGELRNALLVRCVDAVIAVGGSWGTLTEVALAQRTGVPVVALGGWQLRDSTGAAVAMVDADSPAAAVQLALAVLDAGGAGR